ncbi:MAG: leucine--tRNA ligase [Candidatus Lokiarchaeota archaeon]|nr:leucine--tRNA ligase [Candidatus Lokiarchaeota archaeon]
MYDWNKIELKWQKKWSNSHIFEANPDKKKKCFVTFPYPYLNGPLHLGHALTCTKVDIYARFKRMQGFNVLFPFAFHATGEPIAGVAERVEKKEKKQIDILIKGGVPREEIENFSDPKYIVEYYKRKAIKDASRIGFSIDWRRKFTTINQYYKKFITWQYVILKNKGYVRKGTHPVIWCPNCLSPTGDHDRLRGEGAVAEEWTLLKFKTDNAYLIAATLRPETIFGVVNMWLNPKATYVKIKVDDENWIVSKETIQKLKDQLKQVELLEEFPGEELIGKTCKNLVLDDEIPILPAWYKNESFVDPKNATGVVMSVPSHAPFDWVALRDLMNSPDILDEFDLDKEDIKQIEPISLIETKGLGEHPAVDIVEEYMVHDQNDPKCEKVTKIIYKKEFHMGVLKENTGKYAGTPVKEIKDTLIMDLKDDNIADSLWESSEPVLCRCNTRCIIKILQDQWFLTYGDQEWKNLVKKWLNKNKVLPPEGIAAFEYTIDWLRDKACARRSGLGTKLPWDQEWIVETLSDSTIYMSFYTISHIIYDEENKIKPENLVPELFDYIYLGKGSLDAVSESSGINKKLIEKMKNEFEYWYPVNLRNSAKELIYNHLTFFLFQHVAIWPEKYWPKIVGVNGMIQIEGEKMSKSRGLFITMDEALKKYGADVTRLELAYISQGMTDPDWKIKTLQDLSKHLNAFVNFVNNLDIDRNAAYDSLDNWLKSRVNKNIKKTTEHYEILETRDAIQFGFFNIMNDIRWYLRRKKTSTTVLIYAIESIIKLMTPIIPHIMEELWENLGKVEFVSLSKWPTYDPSVIDSMIELQEDYIKDVLLDIREIKEKILKLENPKLIKLFVSPKWKYNIYKEAKDDLKNLKGRIMQDLEIRKHGKDAIKIAKKLERSSKNIKIFDSPETEYQTLKKAVAFLKIESNAQSLEILYADSSDNKKAKYSEPMKPGIYIETE